MRENKWIRLLAYVTGLVNQELLLQNEYLAAENRILRANLPRLCLSDPEKSTLAEIGKRLGRKALAQVVSVAKPDRTLFWTTADLEAKLREFQKYFNEHRTHAELEGRLPNSDGPGRR